MDQNFNDIIHAAVQYLNDNDFLDEDAFLIRIKQELTKSVSELQKSRRLAYQPEPNMILITTKDHIGSIDAKDCFSSNSSGRGIYAPNFDADDIYNIVVSNINNHLGIFAIKHGAIYLKRRSTLPLTVSPYDKDLLREIRCQVESCYRCDDYCDSQAMECHDCYDAYL